MAEQESFLLFELNETIKDMKITTKEEAKAKLEEAIQIQKAMQEFMDKDDSREELFKERDEWFLNEILKDLNVGRIESNCVEYQNSNGEWMIQDHKDGEFWFSSDRIWLVLRDKYKMHYTENQQYLKDQLLMHLNWKVEKTKGAKHPL